MADLLTRFNEMLQICPEDSIACRSLQYVMSCLDGSLPGQDILLATIVSKRCTNDFSQIDGANELVGAALEELEKSGYLNHFFYLTPQEHYCIGSTDGQSFVEEDPLAAYTPFGVLEGSYGLDQIRVARDLAKAIKLCVFPSSLFDGVKDIRADFRMLKGSYILLQSLDESGRTTMDPMLVDSDLNLVPGLTPRQDFRYLRE
ncbi:hypothetical protein CL619_01405 [archaeon]|nr:hypothetical protein [archaeon]|tara:strand:- start:2477 stop:3082 length:606 start_codon:yes stop_codon:yes gene_type:complete